jgi:hypothetical protein
VPKNKHNSTYNCYKKEVSMFTKQWFVGLVVLLLLGFSSELVADKFAKVYGDSLEHSFYYVCQTSDGGYIAGGHGRPPGAYYVDALAVKIDSAGTMEWAKAYGSINQETGNTGQQTLDGGFIMAGTVYLEYRELLVIKCSSAGAIQRAHRFSTQNAHVDPADIRQTSDGGYVVAGAVGTSWPINLDIFILKLNSVGDIQWAKTYDDTLSDCALSIQQTSDSGYIAAGYTSSGDYGYPRAALVFKLSSTGAVQWSKTFGGISSTGEEFRTVHQTSDGGYIAAGTTISYGAGNNDFLVVKLSSTGDLEWAKTFGGTGADFCYSLQQTSDGGCITAGITLSYGAGQYDFLVMKLSSAGDIVWARIFGGSDVDYAQCIQKTSDDGYILAGYTRSYGAGYNDLLVCKLESDGAYENCFYDCSPIDSSISPAISSPSVVTAEWAPDIEWPVVEITELAYSVDDVCPPVVAIGENVGRDTPKSIYLDIIPSVGKNNFSIKYGIPKSVDISHSPTVSLKLYDAVGRLERVLFEKNIRCWCQAGSYTRRLNLSELQSGVYFLRLEAGNEHSVRKFVFIP